MRNSLFALLQANSRRGSFKAEGSTILVYDVIVGSDAEAEWLGGVSPEAFRKALASIDGDVTIRVNSPGGDVFGARAMVQAMKEHAGKITVHVDGYAASAASLIAAAGDTTIMADGAFIMIHNSWTITLGNSQDHDKTKSLLDQIDQSLAETYAARGKKTAEEFAALMTEETWLGPAAALEAGLADEVMAASDSRSARAQWNLAAYRAAPAAPPAPPANNPDPAPSPSAEAQVQQQAEARIRAARLRLLAPL